MFGNHRDDFAATLRQMQSEALERSNFNQTEARAQLVQMVTNDRRFDTFDPQALVDHVRSYAESGRSMDWDNPSIKKGGAPRPGAGPLLRKGVW
jgi:hypothetical protein